jgi:hypothetical protein
MRTLLATLALLPLAAAPAYATDAPAWKQPLSGTAATLGDDGGGEDQATVCDTVEHWRAWLSSPYPDAADGCARYPRGLPVVVEDVEGGQDVVGGQDLPLVKIRIPVKRVQGYVQMLGGIHPVIPPGAIVHLKSGSNSTIRLAPTPDAGDDEGADIGGPTTAKVLRYTASPTGDRDLYVTVLNGSLAGQSGWVSSYDGVHGDDGAPIDNFAGSVIDAPRRQAAADAAPAPSGPREWKGANGWQVSYVSIPGRKQFGCVMTWSPNQGVNTMLWVWDDTMLEVGFMGAATSELAQRLGVGRPAVGEARITVDSKILFTRPAISVLGAVVDLPSLGRTLVIEPVFVSWDTNNEGHDTGLETAAIFDRLRSGRVLSATVYGQNYQENLTGVGSALDLFPKGINYAASQQ